MAKGKSLLMALGIPDKPPPSGVPRAASKESEEKTDGAEALELMHSAMKRGNYENAFRLMKSVVSACSGSSLDDDEDDEE